ncbi:putative uracil permease [Stachybotrys elegans]|uniref:Uracil permease n=1 Tax=Stachybotrys elegans TaxID=80388 RepID=A0A8K0SFI3_9HYPO|nr:putative uracil permease [Stachybotrys elegans]
MANLRNRLRSSGSLKDKLRPEAWVLQKEESSWAPSGTWSNRDLDITPRQQQTWTSWTIFGYWFSDVISIQSWQTGSTILALGLTWREAILAVVLGSFVMGVPMALNGYIGAKTHAPFPILARSSFGYYFSYFPVVLRLVTALFWHAITNFLGVGPTVQVIRAIWPSFETYPNSIPESVGVTSQQLIAYFVFWALQFPLLLIHPEKLRHLFTVKVVACTATIVGMVIWTCQRAGGGGDIWDQSSSITGSRKAWLTVWALNSCTASWSTVGVNIPDFTRYLKKPRSAFSQAIYFPIVCSWVAILGIVVASASRPAFSDYVWDPIAIISSWHGPGGRAAAFFAGGSWMLAQICVNISATVISGSNDLVSLMPKYFNIRRGAIFITMVSSWAMVPWKILASASSLLAFMGSLGIFLAPMMGIQIADFYVVKRGGLDLPALYHPHGRYRYKYGVNWRAALALACAIGPTLPGLAYNVNQKLYIGGAMYVSNFSWYYDIIVAFAVYSVASLIVPAEETLVEAHTLLGMQLDEPYDAEADDLEKAPKVE